MKHYLVLCLNPKEKSISTQTSGENNPQTAKTKSEGLEITGEKSREENEEKKKKKRGEEESDEEARQKPIEI